ncbi:MAG TPA: 2Fe-2S iron-sulfur cluster binding domain-containing protein [Candidatus Dormibacteraeota bacterium]|jgi:propane monooxygenase reductase subunit
MSPRVVFEPIAEEIECEEDESVLDAAFRQGLNLAHGCREGQCSACKSYLLQGEVSLRRYSSFALSDSEEANGYTLLCRAMPDEDLVVELLHYDPDNYRLENPIRDVRTTVVAVEPLTHDIRRLLLRIVEPEDFAFVPGQYVDVHVPGTELRRAFSMANVPGDGHLELIVKRYPGGRFSGMLDGELATGDELSVTGPYGAFHLRRGERPILLVAGGSGMAPVLALLRQLASQGSTRTTRFLYGARTRPDLFHLDLVEELGASLVDFRFTPVLSHASPEDAWEGEQGLVHEAVGRCLASGELEDPEIYMCGPPPMIDAVTELVVDGHGIAPDRIHFDSFTTSADAGAATGSALPQR